MGPGARYGGDADPGQPRARRYPARADLYRADFLGAGSAGLWACDADLRRPARHGLRGRARDRWQESGRDPRRQAPAEQSFRRPWPGAISRTPRADEIDGRRQSTRGSPRQYRQAPAALCGCLINTRPHPEERPLGRVSKDDISSSWFETREDALLTMRAHRPDEPPSSWTCVAG